MLFDKGCPFRHDWEAVITPVVNSLLERGDVDGSSLFAYGCSQAGYWLKRVLAFEHRLVAAVVDPGVMDEPQNAFFQGQLSKKRENQ